MADEPRALPTTVQEAVQWMYEQLDAQSRESLKAMPQRDLILLHHGYGTGIRNELGLWSPDSSLMQQPELAGQFPDNASMILIERLWQHLQDENDAGTA